jgi:hypothetical protein
MSLYSFFFFLFSFFFQQSSDQLGSGNIDLLAGCAVDTLLAYEMEKMRQRI